MFVYSLPLEKVGQTGFTKMKKRGISTILAASVIAIMIFIGFMLVFYLSERNIKKEGGVCLFNGDCVKVQTECCPCSSGGSEKCVAKSEAASYEGKLKNCSKELFCAQVYNCNISECKCKEGRCVG